MDALEAQLQLLGLLVYGDEVKKGAEEILAAVPNPDTLPSVDEKVRALLLRARTRLLLPAFSKEAEQDINKALKLNQNAPNTWVALSEAFWRRNALREAKDALDSALKLDAKCQAALCQYSRILRSMCSLSDTPNEQKLAYLAEAEAKAREAVAADLNDGESWSVLAVAILQQAVANGMDLPLLKKTLSALNQAAQKLPQSPDVFYNRGVVHQTFGHFGSAAEDFLKAFTLDPKGLRGARKCVEDNVSILMKCRSKLQSGFGGMTERDFKKNIASKLPAKGKEGNQTFVQLTDVMDKQFNPKDTNIQWVAVKVLDQLSGPVDQPLVYLVADKDGNSSLLLAYRVLSAAIKVHDTVMIPFPPSSGANLAHTIPDIEFMELKGDSFVTPMILVEPSTLIVNGGPIPAKNFKMPQMGTRQFQ